MNIWNRAGIPTKHIKNVTKKVRELINRYQFMLRHKNMKISERFPTELLQLFDISNNDFEALSEAKKKFLNDQRSKRSFKIVDIENVTTTDCTSNIVSSGSSYEPSSSEPGNFGSPVPMRSSSGYIKLPDLRNFSIECDRLGISDRVASALATTLLRDMNVKGENGQNIIIDRNRVRREREKIRKIILNDRANDSIIKALAFDSRIDNTFVPITIDGKQHPRLISENHMTIVAFPSSIYMGHITNKNKATASQKAMNIANFFDEQNIRLDHLIAVCCDTEATNTGKYEGILRRLEIHFNRPLHWFPCLIHLNERPLTHLFTHLYGRTSGPRTIVGLAEINKCEDMPVKKIVDKNWFNLISFFL